LGVLNTKKKKRKASRGGSGKLSEESLVTGGGGKKRSSALFNSPITLSSDAEGKREKEGTILTNFFFPAGGEAMREKGKEKVAASITSLSENTACSGKEKREFRRCKIRELCDLFRREENQP